VGDAALEPVVFDAGGGHHVLQRGMAVGAQRHQLLHVALEGGVIALAQELQAPAPLLPVQLRAEQQGRIVAEHPFEQLGRRMLVGPGLAVAHRDLRRIGKARLQRGVGLAVDDDHFMATFGQVPRGADADDPGAENECFHGPQCAPDGSPRKAKLNCLRKDQNL
jgi:hypothetical protein